MKHVILISALALVGCSSTPIAVVMKNPYEFPPSLLDECKEPEFIDPTLKLSDNIKIMVDNNTKHTECRVAKKALNEIIQMRKEVYNKDMKK